MTQQPFNNNSPMAERRQIIRGEAKHTSHERPEPTTFHALAGVDASLEGGRFAQQDRVFTGSQPAVHYPRLPASSPWASDPVPAEAPLGAEVDALEPVGTAAEIQASLAASFEAPASASSPEIVETGDAANPPTMRIRRTDR